MATRTYFCERDNQNKIYTTTNKIERFFESQLPMHQYTETWYLMTVSEEAKERVEELIGRSIDQYRDADTGAYILGVGDCNDDTGLDIWLPGQDFAIDDLQGIDGVQIDEQCTFEGYLDESCPNNTYIIFGRYNGDDYLDCGYDVIEDDDLIEKLDDFMDSKHKSDEQHDSPYCTYYESDMQPSWTCYTSHMEDKQWFDYCIEM